MLEEERGVIDMLDELEDYHEKHGFDPVPMDPLERAKWEMAAKNYNTRKVVTFKAHSGSLEKFKHRAQNEGIPYQTLLNSVMKKYAEGGLIEKSEFYNVK